MPKIKHKQKLPLTPRQERAALIARIEALKPFPEGWRKKFADRFPAYDTIEWGEIIRSVVTGHTANKEITEMLEELFGKRTNSKKKAA